ncbi:NRXN2 [Cordylochernes scorpioides]|uniref:NRXN2 n=1 Tax=Cordylochernes scorpioides TaxID=51811 RepID=A0ABY6LB74_9ARAC|nr:NRXN2 [Cordylochernes scorpioides]
MFTLSRDSLDKPLLGLWCGAELPTGSKLTLDIRTLHVGALGGGEAGFLGHMSNLLFNGMQLFDLVRDGQLDNFQVGRRLHTERWQCPLRATFFLWLVF